MPPKLPSRAVLMSRRHPREPLLRALLSGMVLKCTVRDSDAASDVMCTRQAPVLPGCALAPFVEVHHFSTCLLMQLFTYSYSYAELGADMATCHI